MAADKGIEIPIVLNADGSVEGLERITEGLEKIRQAAAGAGSAMDKVGGGAGGGGRAGAGGGGGAGTAGGGSWWESKSGELAQKVISAGMTFVERSIPKLFDPFTSNQEKLMDVAPIAARLTAQTTAGSAIQAANSAAKAAGAAEIPEALQQQIIQIAGTFAEETAKRLTMFSRMELEGARRGAEGTLMDFANVGVMPDKESILTVLQSHQTLVRRQLGLKASIADAANGLQVGSMDPIVQKMLNAADKDVGGAMTNALNNLGGGFGGGG